MNARIQLTRYLDDVRRRIRTFICLRAAGIGALVAFATLLASVWLLQREGFAADVALGARVALLVVLATAVAWTVWALRRLQRDDGAMELERRLPAQSGRLRTWLDAQRRHDAPSPLLDLLAADALAAERATPVQVLIPSSRLWLGAGVAAAVVFAVSALLLIGPSYWGYGSRHLLLGATVPREAVPVRRIAVTPGDLTVRRNSDVVIRASVTGFEPDDALVFVRYDESAQWERAPMQVVQQGDDVRWEFRLFALRAPLHYYVTAQDRRGEARSAEHAIAVVDLPQIDKLRLTYHYPQWTALPRRTEETVRDIRAVADTRVTVEAFADAPLQAPVIVVDGKTLPMQATPQGGVATLELARPGTYRIGAQVVDEWVALTDDYRIDIVADEKPSIEIRKPGRDWRATSIEEVPVAVQAQDDFRLQQVELRYSVNGGKEQSRRLAAGTKQADVDSLLQMEELGPNDELLSPGDLVSYYAVAKDRGQQVETDLFVVQVQPFERRFSEGQGGGGGGGGMGDEQGAISERQREILLATWNTQRSLRNEARSHEQLKESAQLLAELQTTLATQARTLAERTRARTATSQDERIAQFVESLERAAAVMDPAAKHLDDFELDAAVPLEQQALQQLLRAESAFRDVQVSMQRDASASGGGQQAQRNFTEMFELEMDVDKNHYETESALSERNDSAELDDAIRKLKELAERQERLAQQAKRNDTPLPEQRWQQEQLRREVEDLQRRLAELQRSQSQGQSSQSQSSQNQSSQSDDGEQRGEQNDEPRRALDSMREALEGMRAANTGAKDDREAAQRSAAEAGRDLRQALDRLQSPRGEGLAQELERLAGQAGGLANQQRRNEAELYDVLDDVQSPLLRSQVAERLQRLVADKRRMADEVGDLQQDMRAALNEHGNRNPQATRKLGEALTELEAAGVANRLERSAVEIRYGRARDVAPREGLISEGLETLANNLRSTAQLAAGEQQGAQQGADAQQLLAELGELRRALRQAQQPQDAMTTTGANTGTNDRAAWDPRGMSAPLEEGQGRFRARDAAQIAQRLEALANQAQGLQLSASDLQALRRTAREARGLGNHSMAQLQALSKTLERLELATLAAHETGRDASSAHTSVGVPDAPEQREALAEYYRRLGGECTKAQGAKAC